MVSKPVCIYLVFVVSLIDLSVSRAKAKMLDGKVKDRNAVEVPQDTLPGRCEADLYKIIHEDDGEEEPY